MSRTTRRHPWRCEQKKIKKRSTVQDQDRKRMDDEEEEEEESPLYSQGANRVSRPLLAPSVIQLWRKMSQKKRRLLMNEWTTQYDTYIIIVRLQVLGNVLLGWQTTGRDIGRQCKGTIRFIGVGGRHGHQQWSFTLFFVLSVVVVVVAVIE